ncbi:pentapeptide repeat-containing protein [Streptomyces sp. NPDC094437]|uniref:pentapeptide repeat-containing protein n=1 Tax=Streptomyces sp. NPDC094437 TaxID=3366060 RepID=UPI0038268B78
MTPLQANCAQCFALCCAALPFTRSRDFATDKEPGTPCRNLTTTHRCGIHPRLRQEGFTGCTVYDCFGAGQQVSQVVFAGQDWRTGPPGHADLMFEVFPLVRQLHELLHYLTEALTLPPARPLHADLSRELTRTEALTNLPPEELAALDVDTHRQQVNALLLHTSELMRAGARGRAKNRRGANLMGARLKGADLSGADLRGAYLIAADLTEADLRGADFIGADLRDTNLTDADLTGAFFLTQPQLNAAQGTQTTHLPPHLTHPPHWPPTPH